MESSIIKLENWSVFLNGDKFTAPEQCDRCLQGQIFDHPSHEDGDGVTTSAIKEAEGCLVTTQSGTRYQLGKPDPKWLKWLEEERIPFDSDNPIKITRRTV